MKKFLLSIFAVMLTMFSVQAQDYVYKKVTSTPDDWSGDYLIVYEAGNVAFNGGLSKLDAASNNISIEISNNEIVADATTNAAKFTIAKYENGYYIKSASGYYIGANSDANSLNASYSELVNTISWEDGSPKIVGAKGAVLRYNAAVNNYRFRYFKSGTYTNQKAIALYKYTESTGSATPEPDQPETPVAPNAPTLPAACNFDDAMTVEITGIAEGATAYYSLNGENNWVEGTSVKITETTTVYAKAVKDELSSGVVSETYTKNTPVTPPAEGEVVDVLTSSDFTATTNEYKDFSGVSKESGAVYAGQSAKSTNGGGIQLRSKNSNSGIVTTKSGGKVKSVTIEVESGTNKLDIYGKNTPYAAASDLYDTSKQGTKLGTLSANGTLAIEGDYEYIGLRSNSGALYLTSVSITWDASAGVTPVAPNAPVLTESQTFSGSMTVTITSDVTVYYTTDGTTPSKTNGTEYTAPFEITATTTVKAVAINEVGESEVAEATYTYLEPIDLSNCTVAEAIEAYKNGQTGTATITAYIVGAANGGLSKAEFTSETGVLTNILIADNADETNVDNCMPIKMTSGTAVRNALNLGENKYVYKKKVVVVGELEAYFSVAGMQDVEKAGLYWTVSDAGYATLYLGYKAVIPSTVNAYIVESTNSTHAIMTKVEGVVAANTGLILEGEGEHLFNITTVAATAEVEGNLLKGTVVDENITEDAYVLSDGVNGIGLYGAIMNQADGTAWLNNANKAYLPMSAVANKSAEFFGFDWDGTTAIENVEVENEVKAIYDLTGRRVEEITAPGIYIVNGVKRVVR